MDEFITDVIDIPRLVGFIREQADGQLPYGDLFPPRLVDDVEYELTQVPSIAGQVARYRSWDTVGPIGKRPAIVIVGSEIPPLDFSLRLNEKDIVRLDRLKLGIADRTDNRVVDVITNDAVNCVSAVQNRVTLAHGETLSTGTFSLAELGDPVSGSELVADFHVPSTHKVTASTLWSDHSGATPLTNLAASEAVYRADNSGQNPDAWLLSSAAMGDLVLNAQIRNLAPVAGVVPGVVTADTVRQVAKAFGVNAPLVVSDVERPALDTGDVGRVISDRKVVAVKAGMGETFYGLTAAASTLAGNGTIEMQDAPGIIAYATRSVRPASVITTAEAVAIPVLKDPNALFVLTV